MLLQNSGMVELVGCSTAPSWMKEEAVPQAAVAAGGGRDCAATAYTISTPFANSALGGGQGLN